MQHFQYQTVSKTMETDEHLIVIQAINANKEAFNQLIAKYYQSIYLLSYQKTGSLEEAEDIAQDIFVKAYKSLHTLKSPEKFGSWIYQIAQRHIIDWYRKNRRIRRYSIQSLEEEGIEIPFGDNRKEELDQDLVKQVMHALSELPEAYRLVITLRFLEGMSSKEIARRLGEPAGTIRCRLSRAGAILRKKFSKLQGCKNEL